MYECMTMMTCIPHILFIQRIEIDENAKKPEAEEVSSDALTLCQQQLETRVARGDTPTR